MSRPDRYYELPDGTRRPSVSTILGLIKGDYRDARLDAAAARGTHVHALIAADLRGEDTPPLGSLPPDVAAGFRAWLAWRFDNPGEAEAVETPIVGPHFAGTPDVVYRTATRRILLDLKATSARQYEHYLQLGAYAVLWNGANPGALVTHGLVLRLDVRSGNPEEFWLDEARLRLAAEAFGGLVVCWTQREALKATEPRKSRPAAQETTP
jgi:hypothetical protein